MTQKYILAVIKETIEGKQAEWAKNYLAKYYQGSLDTPEAKKQVEAAIHNMETIEKTLKWLKDFYKKERGK